MTNHIKMKNEHIVCIMSIIVLFLKFLTAMRHLVVKAARLNQPIYFLKKIVVPKFKSKGMSLEREVVFCFHRKLEAMDLFWVKKN